MLKPLPFMHPKPIDAPAKGDGWLHEIKYDGYRTQLVVEDGAARAFTRNGHDWTAKYGPIVAASNTLPCTSAIIDGELIVQGENGVSDFAALRSAIYKEPHRLLFFAFDLLHLNGHDLRDMVLEDRRELLADLIEDRDPIILSSEFDGEGAAFYAVAEARGLEGIVSKKKGSRYIGGETDLWVKTKAWLVEEFDIAGVKRGDDGLPYALFTREGEYVGAAIVSLRAGVRDEFWRFVEHRAVPDVPAWGRREKHATWVQPGMRATVRYLKGSEKLRHASIKALTITPQP
jgi:bifunctional non-homologous end joining protein LigD